MTHTTSEPLFTKLCHYFVFDKVYNGGEIRSQVVFICQYLELDKMLGPMGHWLMMEVHRVSLDMRLVVGGRRGGLSHDLSSEKSRTLLQHQQLHRSE